MKNNSNEKLLPYFWANMIIVGNTDPVKLVSTGYSFPYIEVLATIVLVLTFIYFFRKFLVPGFKKN
jgi:hypothetical protein